MCQARSNRPARRSVPRSRPAPAGRHPRATLRGPGAPRASGALPAPGRSARSWVSFQVTTSPQRPRRAVRLPARRAPRTVHDRAGVQHRPRLGDPGFQRIKSPERAGPLGREPRYAGSSGPVTTNGLRQRCPQWPADEPDDQYGRHPPQPGPQLLGALWRIHHRDHGQDQPAGDGPGQREASPLLPLVAYPLRPAFGWLVRGRAARETVSASPCWS